MWGSSSTGSGSSFVVAVFALTITFSLISLGILSANTTIGMAVYAKKSKKPNEENSNDEGGGASSGKTGDSSAGGSHSKDKNKNNCQGTNEDQWKQEGEPSSNDGSNTGTEDNLQHIGPPKTGEGEKQGNEPAVPPVDTTTPPPPPPPPPTTCEKDPSSPECTKENEQSGPPDCSTNPDDATCKTVTGGTDCEANPDDPSCKPTEQTPGVDCTTNPDDPSCTTPQPVDCNKNPNDPSCERDCTKNADDAFAAMKTHSQNLPHYNQDKQHHLQCI